jgi:hypothetical protein
VRATFRRIGVTAVPLGSRAREALFAIRDGREFMADIRGARNPRQHRLFWALCELCAEAADDTQVSVKKWLMFSLGYVDTWFEPNGRMHLDPKSIAYEAMKQAEFNQMFQAAILKIADRLQAAPKDIINRFNDMVHPSDRYDAEEMRFIR